MTRTAILGLGHYVPSKVVTNDDLAQMFDTSDEWIQQRTGIKERHYIEESGIGASDLAVHAVQMACERAAIDDGRLAVALAMSREAAVFSETSSALPAFRRSTSVTNAPVFSMV